MSKEWLTYAPHFVVHANSPLIGAGRHVDAPRVYLGVVRCDATFGASVTRRPGSSRFLVPAPGGLGADGPLPTVGPVASVAAGAGAGIELDEFFDEVRRGHVGAGHTDQDLAAGSLPFLRGRFSKVFREQVTGFRDVRRRRNSHRGSWIQGCPMMHLAMPNNNENPPRSNALDHSRRSSRAREETG